MKTLTIFTPAYNRANLLPRLYESLCNQTVQDFEWLVVDDGSVDDTRAVIATWIQEQKFPIRYIYQENQGMHGAHNTAYHAIQNELNTCIDSDDYMPHNAVELILNKWNTVDKDKFAGIIGLDSFENGAIIGTIMEAEETTLEDFYLKGGTGDKKLVYRTDVIKQYPDYPIFEGENYVGLASKYILIDQDYKLAVLNEVLVIVEYLPTGSSNTMFLQYLKNPKGFMYYRTVFMLNSKSMKRRYREAIHYVSCCIILKKWNLFKSCPKPGLTFFAIPFGVLLYFYILFKTRNKIH